MKKLAIITSLAVSLFAQDRMVPVQSAVYHPGQQDVVTTEVATSSRRRHRRRRVSTHKRRNDSIRRIGIGAGGGAAIGALAGGGKGAAIGALAGGGAGTLYDAHKKSKSQ